VGIVEFIWLRTGTMADSCENDNESVLYIKSVNLTSGHGTINFSWILC